MDHTLANVPRLEGVRKFGVKSKKLNNASSSRKFTAIVGGVIYLLLHKPFNWSKNIWAGLGLFTEGWVGPD